MSRLLVAGNINLETVLRIDSFPIPYQPSTFGPFGIDNGVSGVGYNMARALHILGDDVHLLTLIGRDLTAAVIRERLRADGISDRFVSSSVERSALSIIAYDRDGKRGAFVDLKDLMQQEYPLDQYALALAEADAVLLTQIAYCRPLIAPAQAAGKLIGVDLQVISSLDDDYKQPYLAGAQVVFMSGEGLPEPPESWVGRLMERFANVEIAVIALGADGALLATRAASLLRVPAVTTRPIVSSSGAGDSLFACFMHYYVATRDAEVALRKATVFASYKIGSAVSSDGFLDHAALEALYSSLQN